MAFRCSQNNPRRAFFARACAYRKNGRRGTLNRSLLSRNPDPNELVRVLRLEEKKGGRRDVTNSVPVAKRCLETVHKRTGDQPNSR